jgi:hypothetical protein
LMNELVINAMIYSQGLERPVVRLALTLNQGELAILVRDGHPGAPQAWHPGDERGPLRGVAA